MPEKQEVSRKLRAIFSADVKGYSALMADDEISTIQTLKAYRKIMSDRVAKHHGRVVDNPGDNLLAEFASAVDAVECAVKIQKRLKKENDHLGADRRLEFRIGVNIGDIVQDEDRIYGSGVNVAARIEGLADPGGICISRNTYDHLRDKLKLGYEYLGEHEVKNIKDPVRVYKVLMAPEDAGKLTGEEPKAAIAKWIWPTIVVAAIVITSVVWQVYQNISKPDFEPASIDKMAFSLPEKPSIAVLPFDNMSGDSQQDYFCEGLSEQIITSLSKVSGLFVIARNSSFSFKGKAVKVQQVAEQLGVRYVLEGSLQKSGDTVRITAQLVDAITGHHLWAETYEREMQEAFALQDEITLQILGSVGAELTKGERERIYARGTDNLEAYLKVSKGFEHFERQGKEENILAREFAKKAIDLDPNYPSAWNLLGATYLMDRWVGSTDSDDPWNESIKAFKKALELDEAHAPSHGGLAMIYGFQKKYEKALAQVQKGIALNPGFPIMHLGYVLVWVGRYEEAVNYFQKAIRHDPKAPTFYYNGLGHAYRGLEQYEDAITAYNKALERDPDYLIGRIFLISAYYLRGREAEARAEVAEVRRLDPNYSVARLIKVLPYQDKKFYDRTIESIRKAGLQEHPPLPLPDKPSIAVLPFVNMSDDPKQEYFSDGITDDLITDLSKISGLFVIARNSTFTYKNMPVKFQQVARDLGVRYVLEGSVRKAADQVRINAQLIDSNTGGHLWAERYDGRIGNIFALQDKITGQIVNALAVQLTADEEISFEIKETSSMEAYDAFLQGWQHYLHRTPEDFVKALSYFKKAIEVDPNYGRAYAALALTCWRGAGIGWARKMGMSYPEARVRARHYLELALKNPTPTAHRVAAEMAFNRQHKQKALAEAKQALALDPNNSENHRMMGKVMMTLGKPEECIASNKRAMLLNPRDKAFPLGSIGLAHFVMGQYEEAVTFSEQALEYNPKARTHAATLAASYGQLGRETEARAALERYLKGWGRVRPGLPAVMYFFPLETEHADRFAEGLLKAGLPGKPGGYYKISDSLRLTGEEIKSVFFGRKARGIWGKSQWAINRPKDGDATYWWGSKIIGNGKSWVEGDMLCNQWRDRYGGLSYCGDIYRNPQGTPKEKNEYVIIDDRGIWGCSLEE